MSGHGLATSDFDGNGTADVVVANTDLAALSVLLGDGSGAFPAVRQPSLGVAPSAVATDDMDRDATADLARDRALHHRHGQSPSQRRRGALRS